MKRLLASLVTQLNSLKRLIFEGEELPDPELRRLLKTTSVGLLGAVGAAVLSFLGAAAIRPLRTGEKSEQWIPVARVDELAAEPRAFAYDYETREGWMTVTRRSAVYSYLDERGDPVILSPRCTHLGCLVRWDAQERVFQCPCHGGRFNTQGEVLHGPPDSPLVRLESKMESGRILVKV
ncbi:MAG TPA: Rieske 2Fe-2S domain-containing protein [Acidobacteriota bacterium]|nr:Rieske 2Fe-2S domain-containing protein [Acidobacteriota bacterium]